MDVAKMDEKWLKDLFQIHKKAKELILIFRNWWIIFKLHADSGSADTFTLKIRLSNHLSGQVGLISDLSQLPIRILSNSDN